MVSDNRALQQSSFIPEISPAPEQKPGGSHLVFWDVELNQNGQPRPGATRPGL